MKRTAPGKFSGGFIFAPSTEKFKEKWKVKQSDVITFIPERVYVPMQQHIGAPAEAVVEVGDHVKAGDLIAEAGGFVSANTHATISGTVIDILDWPDNSGGEVPTIVIKKEENEVREAPEKIESFDNLDKDALVERVTEAGVVGMGGATFPTHVKLTVDDDVEVETIVLNGAECEPFLEADNLLMQVESAKVLTGARIAQKILGAKKVIVAIEDDKPDAIKKMEEAAADFSDVTVEKVRTSYPQGGEKQLLEGLLGVEVDLDGVPVDSGVYLMNVATSAAVADAVERKEPLINRFCTVTGDVQKKQTVSCPIGTLTGDLIDFCEGFVGDPRKIFVGGPMMGQSIDTLEVPITKSSNGLVVMNTEHAMYYEESPCIRCNLCAEVCPMRLEPQNLDLFYRAGEFKRCQDLMAEACINCGACTYVCPARRDLAKNITAAAAKIEELQEA
ncbi:electron transport complex subunit RsxC [Enterococcus sp. 669A]|uniref:Ion-translocating oxidoreductase complex subunit C n=1 Tax=Candidatus Enterococcus moelleringii TaxID=2815325 RepID=A0ABS3L880_9ENTE|nr:electron transport complex subunit RsxC [Enterococcus sp. 669A]MBO1305831.1 electron transport complex subunit RsxC [Enterococcus sp. 669A]